MKKIALLLCFLVAFSVKAQEEVDNNMHNSIEESEVFEQEEQEEKAPNVIKLEWIENYADAVAKSKQENKFLVILFTGSDWCGPCKRLEKNVLNTEKFKTYADKKFVLYKADFPRNTDLVSEENKKQNAKLQQEYSQQSLPTIVVVDSQGNLRGEKKGLFMKDAYYLFFEQFVK